MIHSIVQGFPRPCLEEAEYLASLTPVRLDLLLSLAPGPGSKEEMLVEQEPEEDEQVQ